MALSRNLLTDCLARRGFAFRILDLATGLTLVVTTAGGRVFGPFVGDTDALGWSPGADTFEAALLADPARMLDTYHVDPALDPGTWSLTSGPAGVAL